MAYPTNAQIHEMASAILSTLEVTPLSRKDKMRVAREYALDEFGVRPSDSACGLAVKLSGMAWNETVLNTKMTIKQTQEKFGGTLTDYQAAVYTELHNCE